MPRRINKAQRARMRDFLADRLKASDTQVLEADLDHLLVRSQQVEAHPRSTDKLVYIALHTNPMTQEAYGRMAREGDELGHHIAHVFYKDGENFHVPLGDRIPKKDERSLKRYDRQQLQSMLHLRGLEKLTAKAYKDRLQYFQPQTQRLSESLRAYSIEPAMLDYSHVDREHRSFGFVQNKKSLDYALAHEVFAIVDEPAICTHLHQQQRVGIKPMQGYERTALRSRP